VWQSHTKSNRDSYRCSHSYADGNTDRYHDSHANCDSDSYGNSDTKAYSYSKICSHAESASDSKAAALTSRNRRDGERGKSANRRQVGRVTPCAPSNREQACRGLLALPSRFLLLCYQRLRR
jgi:hypothetical protein